jgi:lysophospholipase L1-like esterase
VAAAAAAASSSSLADEGDKQPVDVVFVGDSIVERFGGTRHMGQFEMPDEAKIFRNFSKTVPSLVLGCAGDTSPNLLYHLQRGVLQQPLPQQTRRLPPPPRLEPRVWVILIGTNDLSLGCSKRTTLAGILQVAQVLHQQRPGARIVVHGLFPREDDDDELLVEDGRLNNYWNKIVWINQQLKKFCGLHSEWRYFDVNNQMLQRVQGAGGSSSPQVRIKPGLMLDGLHPSVEGYELWAQELTKFLVDLLNDGEEETKGSKAAKEQKKENKTPNGGDGGNQDGIQ